MSEAEAKMVLTALEPIVAKMRPLIADLERLMAELKAGRAEIPHGKHKTSVTITGKCGGCG
jgi:hypothetical protein